MRPRSTRLKPTTPKICREAVKETIRIILNEDEKAVQAYIAKFKKQYFNSSFEDMACPSGINGLHKYYSRDSIYRKGTPIHVKGALIYNHYIDKLGLEKKYQKVNEGEKIKFSYLKKPNHLQIEVISCHGELPKEFDLTKDIDYDRMFFKTYLKPIDKILDLLGWESEKKATLFD